jgi:ribonuclease HII
MLKTCCINGVIEAGCDEAGRGPLAGSVFAAAVIIDAELAENEQHRSWLEMLNDSKQLTEKERV